MFGRAMGCAHLSGGIVLNTAVIGDLFVRPEVLAETLRRYLEPIAGEISVKLTTLGYPIEPNISDAELREFVGSEEDALEACRGAEIVVSHMPRLTRRVIGELAEMRALACTRTEPVNINVAACTERAIPIFYAPGRNARAVAEFTVGLIIAELRGK
jgi:D-3-phosphoglycerate dehydrogenase